MKNNNKHTKKISTNAGYATDDVMRSHHYPTPLPQSLPNVFFSTMVCLDQINWHYLVYWCRIKSKISIVLCSQWGFSQNLMWLNNVPSVEIVFRKLPG